jgi:hypothetical protein
MPAFAEFKKPANVVRRIVSNAYPRKKPRLMVETLMADAVKLPSSTLKELAIVQIGEARKSLGGEAANDAARLQSIIDAETYYEKAEELLQAANSNVVAPVVRQGTPSAKLSQAEVQRQSKLLGDLQAVEERIATANVAGTAGPAVLPDRRELATSVLLGRAATLRLGLTSAVAGQDFDALDEQIAALGRDADALEEFVAGVRQTVAELASPQGLLAQGQTVVATMRIEMQGTDPGESRLGGLVAALEQAIRPAALVNPAGIMKLADDLQVEIDAFSRDGGGYIQAATQQIATGKRLTIAYSLFDEAIDPRLERLRLLAEPLGDPILGEMRSARSQYREQIPAVAQQVQGNLKQSDVVNGLDRLIDEAVAKTGERAEALRQEVRKARIALYQQTNTKDGDLKITRSLAAFKGDWNQIDAVLLAIEQMLPGSDALQGQTLANLVAAKQLCDQAAKLVEDLKGSRTAVVGFDTGVETLQKAIADSKGNTTPLGKYDPEAVKAIEKQFNQFKANQPTLPAASAQKILSELQATFDDKQRAAQEVSDYIDFARQNMATWVRWATAAGNGEILGLKPELNSLQVALNPLQAALAAKPPVKADIQRAYEKAFDYFKDLKDERQALVLAKGSEQGLKDQAAATETLREELRQRLKVLEERLVVARQRVEEAKGDENPLDAIERLIKQVGDEIKQQPDAAGATLDRIAQRIDLVYANPEGGMARQRRELPDLHDEWVTARQKAYEELRGVLVKLDEYPADDGPSRAKVDQLSDRLTEYMMRFCGGVDRLAAPMRILADTEVAEPARRKAREAAIAAILDMQRALQAHPLTAKLATAPIPSARAAPKRLVDKLDWLHYAIITSVA